MVKFMAKWRPLEEDKLWEVKVKQKWTVLGAKFKRGIVGKRES